MTHSNFNSYIKSTNVRIKSPVFKIINKALVLGQLIYPKGVENFVRKKFFTPTSKPLTPEQNYWIDQARSLKIKSRGKKVHLWRIGEGPSILFIHGWNGRGVQFRHFFQPALEAGFSIIFFDAPAHGFSEGSATNYFEITASVNKIFVHEITQDLTGVIAHSLGSSVIINHLSRTNYPVKVVMIAPALRLMELVFASFQEHGVPRKTYLKLLKEVEEEFQISFETCNPIDLIYQIDNHIHIIHDKTDKTALIEPSIQVANDLERVELTETEGYGHSRLLSQKQVIDKAINFIGNIDNNSNFGMRANSVAV